MTYLVAAITAAIVVLAGLNIYEDNVVTKCERACDQVAVLNGIDLAEDLCGAPSRTPLSSYNRVSDINIYTNCIKSNGVKAVTTMANKIVEDAVAEIEEKLSNQEQQSSSKGRVVTNLINSRAKEHGLNLTTICDDSGLHRVTDVSQQLSHCGKRLRGALTSLKHIVRTNAVKDLLRLAAMGQIPYRFGNHNLDPKAICELMTSLYAQSFCEANKEFPECDHFLEMSGNCEKILADTANKNEL